MNTLINIVLDRSGSMSSVRDATISGFNELLETHQRDNPDASLTLCLFDTEPHEPIHFSPVGQAEKLTEKSYRPSGNTALLDAVGRAIKRIEALPEQPDRIAFVIITDGHENASVEYNLKQVHDLIDWHTNEGKGWAFSFLGANIDAYDAGMQLGVPIGATMAYNATGVGTQAAFGAVAASTSSYTRGKSKDLGYDQKTKDKVESTK